MVWGCFSYNGVGKLAFFYGTFKSEQYVNILNQNLDEAVRILELPDDYIFQQDNDPKHCSKKTKEFFKEKEIHFLPWPAQSPDLNPIEHLWDYLDRQILCFKRRSKQTFENALQEKFYSIDASFCKKLVDSMPNRLKEFIKANGLITLY